MTISAKLQALFQAPTYWFVAATVGFSLSFLVLCREAAKSTEALDLCLAQRAIASAIDAGLTRQLDRCHAEVMLPRFTPPVQTCQDATDRLDATLYLTESFCGLPHHAPLNLEDR